MMTYCSENGDTSMTFQECLDKSCQIAHYFQDKGFKKVKFSVSVIKLSNCSIFKLFLGRHHMCHDGEQIGLLLLLGRT